MNQPENLIFNFYTRIGENGDKAKCNKCKKDIAMTGGNTTGVRKHLRIKHFKQFEEYLKLVENKEKEKENNRKRSASASQAGTSSDSNQPKIFFGANVNKDVQKKFDDALIEFAAQAKVPFNVFGTDSFKKLINVANKGIVVKHRTTYSRMISLKAKKVLKDVQDVITSLKGSIVSVSFTTDIWTSRAGDSYISLTVQFIDKEWKLHRWTPYVRHFPDRHTADAIAVQLDEMIESLGLNDIDVDLYSINDNAANMKAAIRSSMYLLEYNCDIHTLQLGIVDTFKSVDGMKAVLDKSKQLATFTHKSPLAQGQLKKQANDDNLKFRKLKNPQETRWNSQHENMASVLHLKRSIIALCDNDDKWAEFSLDRNQWKLLEGAVTLLEPFKVATKMFEAEKTPTINLVIERIFTLKSKLTKFIADRANCRFGVGFARELLSRLEQRFPNYGTEVFERRAANYLDPRYKGLHLQTAGLLDETKTSIEQKYFTPAAGWLDDMVEQIQPEVPQVQLSPTSKLMRELRNNRTNARRESKMQHEMMKYESYSSPNKDVDVLDWWRKHEEILPLLARAAKKVLAIPSSSAKSERVFSTGGNVVSVKRGSLTPKKVEDLIIISENLPLLKEFDKHRDDKEVDISEENAFGKVRLVEATTGDDIEVGNFDSDSD